MKATASPKQVVRSEARRPSVPCANCSGEWWDSTACRPAERASCVWVGRLPGPATLERWFADTDACNRYRGFVQGSGHRVTVCTEHWTATVGTPESRLAHGGPVDDMASGRGTSDTLYDT